MNKINDYRQLWAIWQDTIAMTNNSPAMAYFMAHKINEFNARYARHLELLNSKMTELRNEYVMHNDKLQPLMQQRDGMMQYQFASEEMRNAYLEKTKELLDRPIMIMG